MAGASGGRLGRFLDRARTAVEATPLVSVPRSDAPAEQIRVTEHQAPVINGASGPREPDVVDLRLTDALERAERAEAEVDRLNAALLQAEADLAQRDQAVAQARIALRTARLAVTDHLRSTEDF